MYRVPYLIILLIFILFYPQESHSGYKLKGTVKPPNQPTANNNSNNGNNNTVNSATPTRTLNSGDTKPTGKLYFKILDLKPNTSDTMSAAYSSFVSDAKNICEIFFSYEENDRNVLYERARQNADFYLKSFDWLDRWYFLSSGFRIRYDNFLNNLLQDIKENTGQENPGVETSRYKLGFYTPQSLFEDAFLLCLTAPQRSIIHINGKCVENIGLFVLPQGKYQVDVYDKGYSASASFTGSSRSQVIITFDKINALPAVPIVTSQLDRGSGIRPRWAINVSNLKYAVTANNHLVAFGSFATQKGDILLADQETGNILDILPLINTYKSHIVRAGQDLFSYDSLPATDLAYSKNKNDESPTYSWISKSGDLVELLLDESVQRVRTITKMIHSSSFEPMLRNNNFISGIDDTTNSSTLLHSMNSSDGEIQWKREFQGQGLLLMPMGNHVLYAHGQSGGSTVYLKSLNPADGTTTWEKTIAWNEKVLLENDGDWLLIKGGAEEDPAEIIDVSQNKIVCQIQMERGVEIQDVVIEDSRALFLTTDAQLMLFDLKENCMLWSRQAPAWINNDSKILAVEDNYTIVSTQLERDAKDINVSINRSSSIITIFSTANGETIFFENTEMKEHPFKLSDNLVLLPFSNGTLSVFDTKNLYTRWHYSTRQAKYGDDRTIALISGHKIFIISEKHNRIECIDMPEDIVAEMN